jgi:DNA-binding protein Fis
MSTNSRKYFSSSIYDLIELFESNKFNKDIIEDLLDELSFRRSRTAIKLRKEIEAYVNSNDGDSQKLESLINKGREQGFVTYEDLNEYLVFINAGSNDKDDIIQTLNDLGLQIYETKPTSYDLLKNESDAIQDIKKSVQRYFLQLENKDQISDLYEMVLSKVEPALLDTVMKFTEENQSETSRILGLNRTTLRSKIEKYKSE